MSESNLSTEELESLLKHSQIISDDTGQYKKNVQNPNPTGKKNKLKKYSPTPQQKLSAHENIDVKNLTNKQKINTNLLLDTFVGITVELGRTNIQVKDILALGEGSIVELLKPANEPVNLLVNNHLIARGEVVVIDENFGTRITDIIDPKDRLRH